MEDICFCLRIFVNQSTFSLSLRFGDWSCKCGASPLTTKLGRFEVGEANREDVVAAYGDRNVVDEGGVSGDNVYSATCRSEESGEKSCLAGMMGIHLSAKNNEELLDAVYVTLSNAMLGGVHSAPLLLEVLGVTGEVGPTKRLHPATAFGDSVSSRTEAKLDAS